MFNTPEQETVALGDKVVEILRSSARRNRRSIEKDETNLSPLTARSGLHLPPICNPAAYPAAHQCGVESSKCSRIINKYTDTRASRQSTTKKTTQNHRTLTSPPPPQRKASRPASHSASAPYGPHPRHPATGRIRNSESSFIRNLQRGPQPHKEKIYSARSYTSVPPKIGGSSSSIAKAYSM